MKDFEFARPLKHLVPLTPNNSREFTRRVREVCKEYKITQDEIGMVVGYEGQRPGGMVHHTLSQGFEWGRPMISKRQAIRLAIALSALVIERKSNSGEWSKCRRMNR